MKLCIIHIALTFAAALFMPRLAAADVYDRDVPFNGGLKVPASATPGAVDPADTHPGLNLIPWPKSLELKPGRMTLTAASRIVAGDASLKGLADILAGEINLLTGLRLDVAAGPARAGDIVLTIDRSLKAGEPILVTRPPDVLRTTDGAHALTIGEQAVVAGFDYRAVAEGSATLLQAIGQAAGTVSLPKLAIRDWPHADYCGLMVDCGRQSNPAEALKKVVEACRMYKVRYLQLHLTDDQGWCFPSTKYPQLGSKPQGPTLYTLAELKDLVAYADARGIAIVPELEMPGHSGAALNCLPEIFDAINPETKQPIRLGCMNMANEEIYPALDTIIGEMCEVFKSSPYFHIGTDEASMGRIPLHGGYKAFMEKHALKDEGELGNFFIASVNEMIKKHGKKTVKWEGMGTGAAKDMIVMPWILRSNAARSLIDQGYTTITAPWDLEMPWPQWNMYECNCSKLKRGEAVLGATALAWELPAAGNIVRARAVAGRQERTWGPDNSVTEAGFTARFQALDAAVGRLIGIPPTAHIDGDFAATAGTRDLLLPVFACDGNDATFYQSATAPKAGDSFTVTLAKPALVHAIAILTGINGKGLLDGAELQVSADGGTYVTVAKLSNGSASAVLQNNTVKSVRLRCALPQRDPMVIREIKLQMMVELSGSVADPARILVDDSVGVLTADAALRVSNNNCRNPIINRGFKLTFDSGGGNAGTYNGPITGTGTVLISQGDAAGKFRDSPMQLGGSEPNTMKGSWVVRSGRLTLAKTAGVDAVGGSIVVGGQGDNDCICWSNSDQINDAATVELLDSPAGGATLNLNGCNEKFASLRMAAHARILTDGEKGGGVLTVDSLSVDGKAAPRGVYTAAVPWIAGTGFVIVGDVKCVNAAGMIDNANTAIGSNNIAALTAATTFGAATGNCGIPVRLGDFDLTLCASGAKPASYSGFITGNGGLTITAAGDDKAARQPMEITGPAPNSYRGRTVLTCGVLKLNKPAGVVAIPGHLMLGGTAAANAGDTVLLGNDGQLAATSTITLNGKAQPCCLDLAGHNSALAKVVIDGQARIRTGPGGRLTVQQLVVDGRTIAPGSHKAPQPWIEGGGSVTVDPRIDVKGEYVVPNKEIGAGNTGNMTADTKFGWQTGTCGIDLITNGHAITIDSGGGNALCYTGVISGTGDVLLLMAPSSSHLKDTALRLAGDKPNTTSGTFHIRQGRVALEKPAGVDAISGDVIVGGQGFNDCLHWVNDNQIKDSATITLLDSGNSGAAYLSLNGCSETVAALVMTAKNTIKTDSAEGKSGVLTVKSLKINNVAKPAGTYTAATEKWIVGKGRVVVAP